MRIAVTGATGFLGSYIVRLLVQQGHWCRCWHRATSQRFELGDRGEWVAGQLQDDRSSTAALVDGCDALVHAALDRPGTGFRGGEGDLELFAAANILGSLRLFEAARAGGVGRVVVISTCAVHEKILDDRALDEAHPLWATTHYGAHKAALEQFVHSYGLGSQWDICALRPCGIYGVAEPLDRSRWYPLVADVVHNRPVSCQGGGKVVHVGDVARAVELLLTAHGVAGEAYNCCDGYVSDWDVATIAKEQAGSSSSLAGAPRQPKHQIESGKLKSLGMEFGGPSLVAETVSQLVAQMKSAAA